MPRTLSRMKRRRIPRLLPIVHQIGSNKIIQPIYLGPISQNRQSFALVYLECVDDSNGLYELSYSIAETTEMTFTSSVTINETFDQNMAKRFYPKGVSFSIMAAIIGGIHLIVQQVQPKSIIRFSGYPHLTPKQLTRYWRVTMLLRALNYRLVDAEKTAAGHRSWLHDLR